ncbi:MAG: FAD-binding oxidoreductase [Scytonema sp. PMC 1069.18]|nr:FAD-binding oxidoreductase [Scytonema sp. PMC 1069.18]MEC4881013.1 FAD-binding oxidoreductase [Scytonema sp. PMC 1070.18]
MKIYDWIVVGAGITGAALAYELVKKGYTVLLLEQHATLQNATRYSYGGLAIWRGTTPLTSQLYAEGLTRHRLLSEELGADTELRELDLLLTIPKDSNPEVVAESYKRFATPLKLLSVKEACELEPLLNPEAIAGALTVKHGHINPEKTVQAYIHAFLKAGGKMKIAEAIDLSPYPSALTERGAFGGVRYTEVQTTTKTYYSENTVVCAGGLSRQLLQSSNIPIKIYFTHAEMIEIPPRADVQLRTMVMAANLQRFQLEAESTKNDRLWRQYGHELVSPILDAGAIQFLDGSFRLGQISRALSDPCAKIDSAQSEATIRAAIANILPSLGHLPGTWHHCLVSFSSDAFPLIGSIPRCEGIHIFSGFSSSLVTVPPLAQRFANWVSGEVDEIISKFSPARFSNCF